jgi:hypothetical protein
VVEFCNREGGEAGRGLSQVVTWPRTFKNVLTDRAINGTGRDGTVVLEAQTKGKARKAR